MKGAEHEYNYLVVDTPLYDTNEYTIPQHCTLRYLCGVTFYVCVHSLNGNVDRAMMSMLLAACAMLYICMLYTRK